MSKPKTQRHRAKRKSAVGSSELVRPNLGAAKGTWLIIQYALTEAIAKQQKDAQENQKCLEGIKRQLDELKRDLGDWPNAELSDRRENNP
jgi:hypothetical protein